MLHAFYDGAQKQTDKLFNIFTAFALSVFVVPLFIMGLFVKVLQLLSSGLQSSWKEVQQEARQLTSGGGE